MLEHNQEKEATIKMQTLTRRDLPSVESEVIRNLFTSIVLSCLKLPKLNDCKRNKI